MLQLARRHTPGRVQPLSLTEVARDEGLTVAYNYGYSVDEPTVYGGLTPRHISSLVVSYTWCDWTYVFQNDVGWQQDGVLTGSTANDPFASAEWYGVNQYLFYTINDCWRAGFRAEWFRDDDGVRVGGVRPFPRRARRAVVPDCVPAEYVAVEGGRFSDAAGHGRRTRPLGDRRRFRDE